MPIRSAHAALATLCLLIASPAASLTVTLNDYGGSNLHLVADDRVGANVGDLVYPASVPFVDSRSVIDGASTSASDYTLTDSGFEITFDHARGTLANSYAQSIGDIYFRVDRDVAYEALGTYTAIDPDGRETYFRSSLNDLTLNNSTVYSSAQTSNATPNESFVLGGTGGDAVNQLHGSLTGMLVAGHDYHFVYNALISAYPTASLAIATATGSVSLNFVPEPSTGLMMGLGLLVAVGPRRRTH